jgi:signal transduction histidine kinase
MIASLETELERLEARATKLEREKVDLEVFAAVAAHELLEPLIVTEAYATLISGRLDEHEHAISRRDLDVLGRDVARVRALIEALLHDARSGDRLPRLRRADLLTLVHGCLVSLAPEVTARRARVDVAELPQVVGEPRLIGVVLTTVIASALRYGRPGGRLTVTAARQAGRWSISVHTDGPKIPVEERKRIFEPDRHDRPVWGPPGAALGLGICRHLVERHGGRLGVRASQSGNRFFFTLPP